MSGSFIPYGRQTILQEDIDAVREVLTSDWLTTGPKIPEFESKFSNYCGSSHAVAVSSGTAALHCAMNALELPPGSEVIVPAITFVASANAAVYEGAKPIFADVLEESLLVNPTSIAEKVTERTKAIVAVDYAGQPADYDAIGEIAQKYNFRVIADGCHAVGATYRKRPVGTLADMTCFSFHPVKHMTSGEGGMVTTDEENFARRAALFRNHGISSDHRTRAAAGTFNYDMIDLGYNYRLTDIQSALGIVQLNRLNTWIERRQEIALLYDQAFKTVDFVDPLTTAPDRTNSHHLYVVKMTGGSEGFRDRSFAALRDVGIGANVHYAPVYHHTFYREKFGYGPGLCPTADRVFESILTLPVYPTMTDHDVERVIEEVGRLASLR